MWKANIQIYFTVTYELLFLAVFTKCDPVCYSRKVLDGRRTVTILADCNGDPPNICKRFASRGDVTMTTLLNSSCYNPDESSSTRERSNLQNSCKGAIICAINDLPNVTKGSFECSTHSTHVTMGKICTLGCKNGFHPASDDKAMCQEETQNQGGKWSDGNFTCHAITCALKELPNVTKGSFECFTHSTHVTMGKSCTLSCKNGFHPASDNEAMCKEETQNQGGKWSDGNFNCHGCNVWNVWGDTEYKVLTSQQTWDESRQLCESERAHLAIIENKEENDFLQKMVSYCSSFLYIGLSRFETGLWKWIDGTNIKYTNWGIGQPGGWLEDCAYIGSADGLWGDFYCNFHREAVCERRKYLK